MNTPTKPTYNQLKKRVKQLTRENELLQQSLNFSRMNERTHSDLADKAERDLRIKRDELIAAERTVHNLRQVIRSLARAAAQTNEALAQM